FDEPPLQVRDGAVRVAARRWMREGCRAWLDTGRAAMRGRRRDIRRQLDLMRVRQAVESPCGKFPTADIVKCGLDHDAERQPFGRPDGYRVKMASARGPQVMMAAIAISL